MEHRRGKYTYEEGTSRPPHFEVARDACKLDVIARDRRAVLFGNLDADATNCPWTEVALKECPAILTERAKLPIVSYAGMNGNQTYVWLIEFQRFRMLLRLDSEPPDTREKTLTASGTEPTVRERFTVGFAASSEQRMRLRFALTPVDFLAVCLVLNLVAIGS